MTIHELVEAFGGAAAMADVLGVTRQSVYNWLRAGDMPEARRRHAEAVLRERERGDG